MQTNSPSYRGGRRRFSSCPPSPPYIQPPSNPANSLPPPLLKWEGLPPLIFSFRPSKLGEDAEEETPLLTPPKVFRAPFVCHAHKEELREIHQRAVWEEVPKSFALQSKYRTGEYTGIFFSGGVCLLVFLPPCSPSVCLCLRRRVRRRPTMSPSDTLPHKRRRSSNLCWRGGGNEYKHARICMGIKGCEGVRGGRGTRVTQSRFSSSSPPPSIHLVPYTSQCFQR